MDIGRHSCLSLLRQLRVPRGVAAAIVATAILGMPARAPAVCTAPPGDLNANGTTDVVDVVCGVLTALWELGGMTGPVPACLAEANWRLADANCDAGVDVIDVQMLAFLAVGLPLAPSVDADGDGCADTCADTTPPEVAITSPLTGAVFASTDPITVTGTVSDASAVTVTVQGVAATVASDGTWTAQGVPLRTSRNILVAVATDTVGNVGMDTVLVQVDTDPPYLSIEAPPDGVTIDTEEVDASGLVSDLIQGTTIQSDDVTVSVDGIAAEVSNHAWSAQSVRLKPGPNTLTATATDVAGNTRSVTVHVTVDPKAGQHLRMVSGTGQVAEPGERLAKPLVVQLLDAKGDPVVGRPVHFAVVRGSGVLENPPAAGASLDVVTDDDGLASVLYRLGRRTGAGNQRVLATAEGFAGFALFRATVVDHPPARIVVHNGNRQTGVVGEQVAMPLVAYVVDDGGNPVGGVPVTFSVVEGGGHFDGSPSVTVDTDTDGLAAAFPTLGPWPGAYVDKFEATFPGNPGAKALFEVSAETPGPPEQTRITGIVVDNADQPLPGATVFVDGTAVSATTNAEGRFELTGVPVGLVRVVVDGSTTTRAGTWPVVSYEFVTVPGRTNGMGMPVYLPEIDDGSAAQVGPLDVTLHMKDVPQAELTIYGGSATCPDGTTSCVVSFSQVRSDRVPMVPPKGSRFTVAWTVQPHGTRFDPPARVCIPADDPSMVPGTQVDMYSWDHDLQDWVSIGTGTVNERGQLCSDPGFGIVKAGWGGGPPPPPPCKCVGKCPQPNNPCISVSCSGPPDCSCVTHNVDGAGCDDDGNPCTVDVCKGGGCTHQPTSGGPCEDDGNDCTYDRCENGSCNHPPVPNGTACHAPGNECKVGQCQGGSCTNTKPAPDGTPCSDDGNECTADKCKGGSCDHPAVADGAACKDDGNECTLDQCKGGSCDHPPKSDDTPCSSDDVECTRDVCQGGSCQHPPVADGTACSDGDPGGLDTECFVFECSGGSCQPNTSKRDGASCSADAGTQNSNQCPPGKCSGGQCSEPPDGNPPCDDGKFCTCFGGADGICDASELAGGDRCDAGSCRGDGFDSTSYSAGVNVPDALEVAESVKGAILGMFMLLQLGPGCAPDMGWDFSGSFTAQSKCCEQSKKVGTQYFGSLSGGGHVGIKCTIPIPALAGLVQVILEGSVGGNITVNSDWDEAQCQHKFCVSGGVTATGCAGVGAGLPKVLHASVSGCLSAGASCGFCTGDGCKCQGNIGKFTVNAKVVAVGFELVNVSYPVFSGWSGDLSC